MSKNPKNKTQSIQEEEYSFPYHYIPEISEEGFSQAKYWSWGYRYLGGLRVVIDQLNKISFNSLLDIGCGEGRFLREVSQHYPEKTFVGLDYSTRAISLSKLINPELHFIHMDIIKEETDEKYDLLTLIEVFEHIPLETAEQFVQSLSKALNKDGALLLTVPHKNRTLQAKHFQHFSSQSLKSYFEKHFVVEDEQYLLKSCRLSYIINKLLTNKYFILNHQELKNYLYKLYKKHCCVANEKDCSKIYLRLRKLS